MRGGELRSRRANKCYFIHHKTIVHAFYEVYGAYVGKGEDKMDTKTKKESIITCPWCEKGKTKADRPADVNVSCQCTVCGNFYRGNLKTLRTVKARAAPKK